MQLQSAIRIRTKFTAFVILAFALAAFCKAQEPETRTDGEPATSNSSIEQQAKAGDPEAQNVLGKRADDAEDYAEAFKWYELAAKQGLSDAQVNLGFLYDKGLGLERDVVQAAHWYGLAAEQGDPAGMFDIANCYLNGDGVAKDRELAIKWFTRAMEHENEKGASANGIGLAYEDGPHQDEEKDYAEAFHWYRKAAEMGFGEAQYNVCRFATEGRGVDQDFPEAIKWCSQLANSGGKSSDWGQFGMGRMYDEGLGVPQNYKEAAQWYRKSAEQGNPVAQLRLGQLYAEGQGVQHDLIEAYMWAAIAGSEKNPDASNYLEELTERMTAREISAAQARTKKWIQEHPLDPEIDLNIAYDPQ